MKVKVHGDVVTITSIVKFDDLKTAGEIIISDDKGNDVYGMTVGSPSLTRYGFSANSHTLDGYCLINVVIPADIKDEDEMKNFVADNFKEELTNLKKYESLVVKALEEAAATRAAIAAEVEVE